MSQFAGLFKTLKNENEEKLTTDSVAPIQKKQTQTKSSEKKTSAPSVKKLQTRVQKKTAEQTKKNEAAQTANQLGKALAAEAQTENLRSTSGNARRRGKSSNPEYMQVLSYVRKNTYKEVRRALIDDTGQDFSELVENLLSTWLKDKF